MTDVSEVLSVQNLSIEYATGPTRVRVVNDINFTVSRGRTMAIVGESGSGKSTIAQAIMGLLPANANIAKGKILFADDPGKVDIANINPRSGKMRKLRGGRIGMVFQEPSAALSPVYTIGNLLTESVQQHEGLSHREALSRAEHMLNRVGFDRPREALDKYPFELSGGLRQRAMIAAALICNPILLVADEPTSALDVTVQALLLKQISDLQDAMGMSLLLITHDLGVVATVADEVTVLYRGEVMERGGARELLKEPHHPYLKALMKAGPSLTGATADRLTPLRPIAPPSQAFRARWSRQHVTAPGQTLLELNDIVKQYDARAANARPTLAVNHVSLTVKQAECLGLVGESGCGKSTLCKILVQATQADGGTVKLAQSDKLVPVDAHPQAEVRQRIQYVFQDPFGSLNPRRSVQDALVEPFEIHNLGTRKDRAAWAAELLGLVGLSPAMLGRYPNAFSGGQRQRIAIARALALKPDLLVCDEPVSALDVSVQAQILNLLQDLKSSLGVTYLFVSHNLAVVRHLADRVAVMCRGRIVELAPTQGLFADPRHPYTRALMAAAPEPDPDLKLDLTALLNGRASDPEAWDPPFRLLGEAKARYEQICDEHWVAVA